MSDIGQAQVEAAVVGGAAPAPNGTDPSPSPVRPADPYAPRLPAAVQRAAARAEELQRAQFEAENVPQPDEASRELDEAAAPAAPVQSEESWQSRFRTLQGKYDAEVPTLHNQIRQLEHLITTMRSPPERAVAYVPAEPVPDLDTEIPEEDYTTYGNDFVDSTRRWARAELAPVVKSLQQQVAELRGFYQQSTGDRMKDRVRAELDRDPDLSGRWQHLDTDAGFNQWLSEYDQFSGNRRLDMLREAYAGGDAVRTGRFFKAYLQEHTDNRHPPLDTSQTLLPVTRAQDGNGYYGNGAGSVDLSAYAAPGRASNATPGPGAPERRFWTNRDIQAFYGDRMRGRYRGREQEADRLERDILAAAAEGRIRNE